MPKPPRNPQKEDKKRVSINPILYSQVEELAASMGMLVHEFTEFLYEEELRAYGINPYGRPLRKIPNDKAGERSKAASLGE